MTAETDRKIAALEAEYSGNKEKVLQLVMQVVMSTVRRRRRAAAAQRSATECLAPFSHSPRTPLSTPPASQENPFASK